MNMSRERTIMLAVTVGSCLLIGLIFFWIGYASRPVPDTSKAEQLADRYRRLIRSGRGFSVDEVPELIRVDKLRERLQYLSAKPHIAGVEGHNRTAAYFKDQLGQMEGFEVFSKEYFVSLGFSGNSKFTIEFSNGSILESQVQEKILSPYENLTGQVNPILSFTPDGYVEGKAVYANYGRESDFEYLRDTANLNLTGTIALIRYGQIGRGNKLVNAAKYGCVGGIVFSDPADGWADPKNLTDVYPNSWWLPPTGVQRGSAKLRQADPQTPHYPSLDYVFRESYEDIKMETDPRVLSPIPGYPVGYGDAEMLLQVLGGPKSDDSAQGGLPIDYRVGGDFINGATKVTLNSTNRIEEKVRAENVFAVMRGELEPDRYMLIGNHRDGWATGAVDATSGSTTVLEMASALSELYKKGWRPRRSIMLCSWDAEEQGIMGSWEWVEDKFPQIKDKVVAYLNIDISVHGTYVINPSADPLMQPAIKQTLRNVPQLQHEQLDSQQQQQPRGRYARDTEQQNQESMFDVYKKRWLDKGKPMGVPIASSDHSAFIQLAGVPVIDVSYVQETGFYPLYHSTYETFHAVINYIDPGLKKHREVAVWGIEVVRMFADSWLLPYDEVSLADHLEDMYNATTDPKDWGWPEEAESHKNQAISAWSSMKDTLVRVRKLSAELRENATLLQNRIDEGDELVDPMLVRGMNDRRMRLIQSLLDRRGQPRNPTLLNLFFASASEEVRNRKTRIPGLSDLLTLAEKEGTIQRWKEVAQHTSAVAFRVQSLEYQLQEKL